MIQFSLRIRKGLTIALIMLLHLRVMGETILIEEPSLDRWMYVANSIPGSRPQGSTFSALPAGGVEDRFAQVLVGFNLPELSGQIRSVTLTMTVGQNELFSYDPTYDEYRTYLEGNDEDAGRSVELYGVGYREEFEIEPFEEDSPYGSGGLRNAYALGYDSDGEARDVSNNIMEGFESAPWAIGQIDELSPGESVPLNAVMRFELDLSAPNVREYVTDRLEAGYLDLIVSSLHPATQQGGEFVSFFMKEDSEHQLIGGLAATLEIVTEEAAPQLSITRDGGEVVLSWEQEDGFCYSLSSSTSLSSEMWGQIFESDTLINPSASYRADITSGSTFYQLTVTPKDQ